MDDARPTVSRTPVDAGRLRDICLAWYEANARILPWREVTATAWHVLVSELMLQQTPVSRVLPVYAAWVERWPSPADLARVPAGEAVRAWGRLGYPRRALRLHACARILTERHDGRVPDDVAQLRALPGVGDYTAAAVASFAYGQRHAVLDTNVRRVLSRVVAGRAVPSPTVSVAERRLAESLLPDRDRAARWSVAVMELGALVCTARTPHCTTCPVRSQCRWRAAGYPAAEGAARRSQSYAGTDRQCRGRLLAVLRDSSGPVDKHRLDQAWDDDVQRERSLDSLLVDGLVEPLAGALYTLAT